MNNFEKLEDIADQNNVSIIPYHFESKRIKGLYCDHTIALSEDLQLTVERTCILAEELGHHHTSSGVIIDLTDDANRKQEKRARVWAYEKMIGLSGIIDAHSRGYRYLHEIADYLEVTEEFLVDALEYYKSKYGSCVKYKEYCIYFIPQLAIFKRLRND